jgi:hypothetical protein
MSRRIPNSKPITDVSAMAFLNMAREYHSAANQLSGLGRGSLSNPINFLYFHTVELALKAFVRSFNRPIRKSHNLTKVYEECRSLGLKIGPADRFEIGNIVTLLDSGNEDQGFRYFNWKSGSMATSSWIREVVEQLMRAVETHVEARAQHEATAVPAGPAIKLTMIFGKPVPRASADVPLNDSRKS